MAAWLLATPLSASPDEPEHVHKAAAVARGDLSARVDPETGWLTVRAPAGLVSPTKEALCFAFRPAVTADCAEPLCGGGELVTARSEAGRYNPAYYAVVGLAILVLPNEAGIYLMRLTSAVLCAGLLASAFASAAAWRRSRLLVLGLLVSAAPLRAVPRRHREPERPGDLRGALAVDVWTGPGRRRRRRADADPAAPLRPGGHGARGDPAAVPPSRPDQDASSTGGGSSCSATSRIMVRRRLLLS